MAMDQIFGCGFEDDLALQELMGDDLLKNEISGLDNEFMTQLSATPLLEGFDEFDIRMDDPLGICIGVTTSTTTPNKKVISEKVTSKPTHTPIVRNRRNLHRHSASKNVVSAWNSDRNSNGHLTYDENLLMMSTMSKVKQKKFIIYNYSVVRFEDGLDGPKMFECMPDLWFLDETHTTCYFPPKTGKPYHLRAINCEVPGDDWGTCECEVISSGHLTYMAGFKYVQQKCAQKYNTSSADEEMEIATFRRLHPGLVSESIENVFAKKNSSLNLKESECNQIEIENNQLQENSSEKIADLNPSTETGEIGSVCGSVKISSQKGKISKSLSKHSSSSSSSANRAGRSRSPLSTNSGSRTKLRLAVRRNSRNESDNKPKTRQTVDLTSKSDASSNKSRSSPSRSNRSLSSKHSSSSSSSANRSGRSRSPLSTNSGSRTKLRSAARRNSRNESHNKSKTRQIVDLTLKSDASTNKSRSSSSRSNRSLLSKYSSSSSSSANRSGRSRSPLSTNSGSRTKLRSAARRNSRNESHNKPETRQTGDLSKSDASSNKSRSSPQRSNRSLSSSSNSGQSDNTPRNHSRSRQSHLSRSSSSETRQNHSLSNKSRSISSSSNDISRNNLRKIHSRSRTVNSGFDSSRQRLNDDKQRLSRLQEDTRRSGSSNEMDIRKTSTSRKEKISESKEKSAFEQSRRSLSCFRYQRSNSPHSLPNSRKSRSRPRNSPSNSHRTSSTKHTQAVSSDHSRRVNEIDIIKTSTSRKESKGKSEFERSRRSMSCFRYQRPNSPHSRPNSRKSRSRPRNSPSNSHRTSPTKHTQAVSSDHSRRANKIDIRKTSTSGKESKGKSAFERSRRSMSCFRYQRPNSPHSRPNSRKSRSRPRNSPSNSHRTSPTKHTQAVSSDHSRRANEMDIRKMSTSRKENISKRKVKSALDLSSLSSFRYSRSNSPPSRPNSRWLRNSSNKSSSTKNNQAVLSDHSRKADFILRRNQQYDNHRFNNDLPGHRSISNDTINDLITDVKELTKAVRTNNHRLAENDRRSSRMEVTISKIFTMLGDMNGNIYDDVDDNYDFDVPEIPIADKNELRIVSRKLKDNEFRTFWLNKEKYYCCPTKTSTDTVTMTKFLKRFISVNLRCQLTLKETGETGITLFGNYHRVYLFLIDVMRLGYRSCKKKISTDDAHTALRIVWGRSKQMQKDGKKKR